MLIPRGGGGGAALARLRGRLGLRGRGPALVLLQVRDNARRLLPLLVVQVGQELVNVQAEDEVQEVVLLLVLPLLRLVLRQFPRRPLPLR